MNKKEFAVDFGGQQLKAELGELAQQANGSVKVQCGDTVVLATATMSKERREGMNFFPLFVDYEERYYAANKIKGSRFIKREGRPSDKAILNGRIIDRTIRPLFDERMRNEVQVIITVLSIDKENDPSIVGIIAASLALGVSNIPWRGPVAAARIGRVENERVINPAADHLEESDLDLLVAGTADKINMIEADGEEISNQEMAEAIGQAYEEVQKVARFEQSIIDELGKEKTTVPLTEPEEAWEKQVRDYLEQEDLTDAFYTKAKDDQKGKMDKIKDGLKGLLKKQFPAQTAEEKKLQEQRWSEADLVFENRLNEILHEKVLQEEARPDGRRTDEVRKIISKVGVLPRIHGSALFQRGETQVLNVTTLGAPGDQQIIDTMEVDEKKRYIHHYNFPPFSVGEVRPMRGPGRREIGHGALAEKALLPVLPSKEDFPYTMLLVSEVLGSNGSSSMASTCGSTLSLMDAGVPIKSPVSGIAMGIITGENGEYKILSDIQGPEDHWGDMDFKVAGTKDGITAMQMDVKIDGISPEVVIEVLEQAHKARMEIMEVMLAAIPEPRAELSSYAPSIITMKIAEEKIREVIGPGGKIINEIIDETGANIDIEDDGTIFITAENGEGGQKAQKMIQDIVREVEAGEIYPDARVVKLMDFGAFVELWPGGKDGLVHISKIADERIDKVENYLKVGQKVKVKVAEIDQMGRINLTMKGMENEVKRLK